jgi:hypothetical protein
MNSAADARLRRLISEMSGRSLENVEPEEMQRVLRDAGLPVDDPTQVAELWRRWEEMHPGLLQAVLDPETDAFLVVDPVFRAALERLGPRAADADALAAEPADLRAIIVTRLVDGLVDNGGWVAVLAEGQRGILPLAIEGYRRLGLNEHARLAALANARGFEPPGAGDDGEDDPEESAFREGLDEAWLDLPSAEVARAELIRGRPDIR